MKIIKCDICGMEMEDTKLNMQDDVLLMRGGKFLDVCHWCQIGIRGWINEQSRTDDGIDEPYPFGEVKNEN